MIQDLNLDIVPEEENDYNSLKQSDFCMYPLF
jgi:hypothetical protein